MSQYFKLIILCLLANTAMAQTAQNPIIHADVPDVSIIRVGDTYYMSSTTMHMSPGVPIMKSKDLVNWKLVSYAHDVLDDVDDIARFSVCQKVPFSQLMFSLHSSSNTFVSGLVPLPKIFSTSWYTLAI